MEHDKQRLINKRIAIVIVGPTASGKTALSLNLAKKLDSEIISADSRQIYKYLNIGTAKPTVEELSQAPHYFIDILNPDEYFSSGQFGSQAKEVTNIIFNKNKIPIITGGSGLYIKALCEGFFETENILSNDLRTKLQSRLENSGIDDLFIELQNIDPESALLYSDRNPRRIIRALEFYYTTGITISYAQKNLMTKPDFIPIYFGINIERSTLYDRINKRTEEMWNAGLADETIKVLNMGYSPKLNSLNTVGYKECIEYLDGTNNASGTIEKIAQNTRHYAKRQMTWLRRNPFVNWIEGDIDVMAEKIIEQLSLFLAK